MNRRHVLLTVVVLAAGAGAVAIAMRGSPKATRTTNERRAAETPSDPAFVRPETVETPPVPASEEQLRKIRTVLDALEKDRGADGTVIRAHYYRLRNELIATQAGLDDATRNRLLALIFEGDEKWRPLAGDVLAELPPDPVTIGLLMNELREGDSPATRRGILNALGAMPARSAVPGLIELLRAGAPEKHLIVRAIARMGDTATLAELAGWLGGPVEERTRAEIERALATPAGRPALDRALENLAGRPPAEQTSILSVVLRVGDREHARAVRELLATALDPDPRRAAIRALGKFGDVESGRELLRLVDSDVPEDVRAAQSGLRRIREPDTIDALIRENPALSAIGRHGLLEAGSEVPVPGPALVDLAVKQIRQGDVQSRTAALIVIGRSRNEELIEPISQLFRDSRNPRVRTEVLDALLTIRTPAAARRGAELAPRVEDDATRRDYVEKFDRLLDRYAEANRR